MDRVNIQPLEGYFDVFGDATRRGYPNARPYPRPPVRICADQRRPEPDLAQDACYTLENMVANIPPGLAYDIPSSMVNIYHFKTMTSWAPN